MHIREDFGVTTPIYHSLTTIYSAAWLLIGIF
jgi:hypothetical protein